MQKENVQKALLISALFVLIVASYLIIKPFLIAILSAAILSYVASPLNLWLRQKTNKKIAASATTTLVLLILIVPLAFVTTQIVFQGIDFIKSDSLTPLIAKIKQIPIIESYTKDLNTALGQLAQKIISSLSTITISVAEALLALAVMAFVMYTILLEGETFGKKIKEYLPFKNRERIAQDVARTTKELVRVNIILACAEFIVGGVAFWLAGSSFFLVLATGIALFAFIPGGPGIIWIPLAIIKIIDGNYLAASIVIGAGLIISIYIDTILRTKLSESKANINPAVTLVGILGGTVIFGIPGLIIGPLLLTYTLKLIKETLADIK
jgi:predicted PurR-regulated permease PerM